MRLSPMIGIHGANVDSESCDNELAKTECEMTDYTLEGL